MESKYDEYGVLKTIPWPIIVKGDMVRYTARGQKKEGKKAISYDYPLYGVWDGKKVEFNDPEQHIVRTIRWLIKI